MIVMLAAIATRATASESFDFSATSEEYVGGGIVYRRLAFRDDAKRIEMELPSGWSYRSSPERLQLVPANPFAEGIVKIASLPVATAFAAQVLEQEVLSGVPPGSQAVKVIRSDENPGGPGGGQSFEVFTTYKLLGRTFVRSSLFVGLPKCRLLFQFTATDSEFPTLYQSFRRAIQSWEWK